MDNGYVYIGRLVDPNGNFVTSYFKIGKSYDFKTREINLNSTHMPLDVVFVRVFQTELMSSLEKILHACFDEYRVVKEYDWRRNITTEWFDLNDEELINDKIDTITKNFPNTSEVDMILKIQSETGTSLNQKTELINAVKKTKVRTQMKLFIDGEECTGTTAKQTMRNAYTYIANKVGWETLEKDEDSVTKDINEFKDRYANFNISWTEQCDDYFIMTAFANDLKVKIINRMVERYGLPEVECSCAK